MNRAYVCDFRCGAAFENICKKLQHQTTKCPNRPISMDGRAAVHAVNTLARPLMRAAQRSFTASPALQARGLLVT
jgi:hypothetical protein